MGSLDRVKIKRPPLLCLFFVIDGEPELLDVW
jgi:hypothetical protein